MRHFAVGGFAITLSLWVALTSSAGGGISTPTTDAAGPGEFIVKCSYDHTGLNDPIKYPDQPNASHSHDFFGNLLTDYHSDLTRMLGGSTSCDLGKGLGATGDTGAYWSPSPSIDGVTYFHAGNVRAYYTTEPPNTDTDQTDTVATIPSDLQMIAGDPNATQPQPMTVIKWFCGANNTISTPVTNHPYNCNPYFLPVSQGGNGYCGSNGCTFVDGPVVQVIFPNCWDGTGLGHGGVTDVAYENGFDDCVGNGSFTHYLPTLVERFHFGDMDPNYKKDPCRGATPCGSADTQNCSPSQGQDKVALGFSTGNGSIGVSIGSWCTIHADFWNTWQQPELDEIILSTGPPGYPAPECLNAHRTCSFENNADEAAEGNP